MIGTIWLLSLSSPMRPERTDPAKPTSTRGLDWPNYQSPADLTGLDALKHNVDVKSWMSPVDLGIADAYSDLNDNWVYSSPAGREYALLGYYCGVKVVEVTDNAQPRLVYSYEYNATSNEGLPCSYWKDIKVNGEYAYAVADRAGVQDDRANIWIFDLTQIDSNHVSVTPFLDADGNEGLVGAGSTHNLIAHDGYIYRLGGILGIRVLDVSGEHALSPQLAGEWGNPNKWNGRTPAGERRILEPSDGSTPMLDTHYIHDAELHTYSSGPYAGKTILFAARGVTGWCGAADGPPHGPACDYYNAIVVLDVTDKANIQLLSYTGGDHMDYAHQLTVDIEGGYLYLNDEGDESFHPRSHPLNWLVYDISTLDNVKLVNRFSTNFHSIGHNCYIRPNKYMTCSNYVSGLAVFDLEVSPLNPPMVAFFDAELKLADTDSFDGWYEWGGSWSNSMTNSGTIIYTDGRNGLFLLELTHNRSQIFNPQKKGPIGAAGYCDAATSCDVAKSVYQKAGCCVEQ